MPNWRDFDHARRFAREYEQRPVARAKPRVVLRSVLGPRGTPVYMAAVVRPGPQPWVERCRAWTCWQDTARNAWWSVYSSLRGLGEL